MSKDLETATEQLDKALTEIDVLADKDQAVFRVDSDTFLFNQVEYKLIEDHQEAFDMEMMENRFTDYLLKYDYIVGDIAYEKLRLRGFYEDHRKGVPIDMKISNVEDYLLEYCNFGCQYFVFERVEKKEEDPESYFKRSNKSNRQRKSQNKRRNQNKKPRGQRQQGKKQENRPTKQKDFQVKKKQSQQRVEGQKKTEEVKTRKTFQIRKKTEE